MVRNRATITRSPATPTIAEIRSCPSPVIVTTPAMIPATPQATATESVFLPPASNALMNLVGFILVSLFGMLTRIARAVAMIAARDIV